MDEINYIADFSVPNKSALQFTSLKFVIALQKKKLNSIYIQMKIIFPSKYSKVYNSKKFQIHYCFEKKKKKYLNNFIFLLLKKELKKILYPFKINNPRDYS